MKFAQLLLIGVGLVPMLIVFAFRLIVYSFPLYYGEFRSRFSALGLPRLPWEPTYDFEDTNSLFGLRDEAPAEDLGGGTPLFAPHFDQHDLPERGVLLRHSRCHPAEKIATGHWRIAIELEINNQDLQQEIVLDDFHTRLFFYESYEPQLQTISHFGDVVLTQDNCIIKDPGRTYSLPPLSGWSLVLRFEIARRTQALGYHVGPTLEDGGVLAIFGILLSYHPNAGGRIRRSAVPSDCIYVFQYPSDLFSRELSAADLATIEELKFECDAGSPDEKRSLINDLEFYYVEHQQFDRRPET